MQPRILWLCMVALCITVAGCNKKVKKTAPAAESKKNEQSLVEQTYLELAQSSDEYGNEEGEVTDYDYGTDDDLSTDDDNSGDSEYNGSDDSDENNDEGNTSDTSDDDASEDTGW